jgi:hypothetical protein
VAKEVIPNSQPALQAAVEPLPNPQYVICVPADNEPGKYAFRFAGKNFSALAINPDYDWVMKTCSGFKSSGMGNGHLVALVSFSSSKKFKKLTARDDHEFICWVKT